MFLSWEYLICYHITYNTVVEALNDYLAFLSTFFCMLVLTFTFGFLRMKFMHTCKLKIFDKLLEVNWLTKSV